MRKTRLGLTLIELLVSISLGMILIFLATSALFQVQRAIKRDAAIRQLHEEAGAIYRQLKPRFTGIYPASLIKYHPYPIVPSASDPKVGIQMTWMSALKLLNQEGNQAPRYSHDLVWNKLRWKQDDNLLDDNPAVLPYVPPEYGKLFLGTSTPERRGYTAAGTPVVVSAQPRRDASRDLNDNGFTDPTSNPSNYNIAIEAPGDERDLDGNLSPLVSPNVYVVDFEISWVTPGSEQHEFTFTSALPDSIDGVFLDGRAMEEPGETLTATRITAGEESFMARRPEIIRVSFTLVASSSGGLSLEDEPSQDFTFCFAAAPHLPELLPPGP